MTATPLGSTRTTRPRVEGDREAAILGSALEVMRDVGYDRLTMDAVAARARASKATLYRRWGSKVDLVVEALQAHDGPPVAPDTGNLRDDLLQMFCGPAGMADDVATEVLASLMTALRRDPGLAAAYRRHFLEPRIEVGRAVYQRAQDRGEIRQDVDTELLAVALPGIVLHSTCLLGDVPTRDVVARVIDEIILPAASPLPGQ